jgi:hypothetical protein
MDVFLNGVSVFQTPISGYVVGGTAMIDNTSKLSLRLHEDFETGKTHHEGEILSFIYHNC